MLNVNDAALFVVSSMVGVSPTGRLNKGRYGGVLAGDVAHACRISVRQANYALKHLHVMGLVDRADCGYGVTRLRYAYMPNWDNLIKLYCGDDFTPADWRQRNELIDEISRFMRENFEYRPARKMNRLGGAK